MGHVFAAVYQADGNGPLVAKVPSEMQYVDLHDVLEWRVH